MVGEVHCGTVKRFENPTFKNRNTHAANVPHLPVWSNNPLRHVTSTALPMHHPDGFSHGSSVIRVDCGQILLKVRCPRSAGQDRKFCIPRQTNRYPNHQTNGCPNRLTPSSPYERGAVLR